jgi:hypothetical protein
LRQKASGEEEVQRETPLISQVAAGRRLWLIDLATWDLRTCAMRNTSTMGIDCLSPTARRARTGRRAESASDRIAVTHDGFDRLHGAHAFEGGSSLSPSIPATEASLQGFGRNPL